jgi:hypothetical protein
MQPGICKVNFQEKSFLERAATVVNRVNPVDFRFRPIKGYVRQIYERIISANAL